MITKTNGNFCNSAQQFFGLSTDTKPTECIANASVFYEMDTKKTVSV